MACESLGVRGAVCHWSQVEREPFGVLWVAPKEHARVKLLVDEVVDDGVVFLSEEFVDRETLKQYLSRFVFHRECEFTLKQYEAMK